MKFNPSFSAAVAALVMAIPGDPRAVTVIDDTQICTIYDSTLAWNMTAERERSESRSGAPFTGDQVLGVRTLVFSDATNEVFPIERQPGNLGGSRTVLGTTISSHRQKYGGYSHLTWRSTYNYVTTYDRGYSDPALEGTFEAMNFFAYNSPPPNYTRPYPRSFTSTTVGKKRASMKIDYQCTTPTALGYSAWIPLGNWNMRSTKTKTVANPLVTYGISVGRVVDLDATIRSDSSDENNPNNIEVDNLQHATRMVDPAPYGRNRGGILWLGAGCQSLSVGDCGISSGASNFHLKLYAGPGYTGGSIDTGSLYRRGSYNTPSGSVSISYTATNRNRGWAKVQYTGPKSSTKVPYAMKTKVVLSDAWNMTTDPFHDIDVSSDLLVAANRITGLSTTIVSDAVSGDANRTKAANFHRPRRPGHEHDAGGVTYFDGANRTIKLGAIGYLGGTPRANFFDSSIFSGSNARARVSIDYLVGACPQGPTGFQVDAIPSGPNRTGDCDGASNPFVLTGTGDGSGVTISDGSTADGFVFFSKDASNTGTKILSVRLDDIETYGQGGISFRVSKAKGSAHATLYMDANGILRFVTRNGTGNANVEQAIDYLSFPIWIALQQSGNTFTARYNTSLSTSHPGSVTSWTQLGSTVNLGSSFSGEMYRIGMTVSGHDYFTYQTQDVQMRTFTENN